MTDIAIQWNTSTGTGDWAIAGGDLLLGGDLLTAVIISLFTDARAPEGVLPPSQDPRGWWGDTFNDIELGSLLWTLARVGISNRQQLLRKAEDYASNSLAWLVTDGIAASVTCVASFPSTTALLLVVTIKQPGQNTPQVYQFSWAWAEISPGGT